MRLLIELRNQSSTTLTANPRFGRFRTEAGRWVRHTLRCSLRDGLRLCLRVVRLRQRLRILRRWILVRRRWWRLSRIVRWVGGVSAGYFGKSAITRLERLKECCSASAHQGARSKAGSAIASRPSDARDQGPVRDHIRPRPFLMAMPGQIKQ